MTKRKIITELEDVETRVVHFLTTVKHDGEVFLAGAEAEIERGAAETLAALGAVKLAAEIDPPPPAPADAGPASDAASTEPKA